MTFNQTHIGKLHLEEADYDIGQEEPEEKSRIDPEQAQFECRIR